MMAIIAAIAIDENSIQATNPAPAPVTADPAKRPNSDCNNLPNTMKPMAMNKMLSISVAPE